MNSIITFIRQFIIIPIGIVFIICGILLITIDFKNQNYIKIEATVSKTILIEDTHYDENGNQVEAIYKIFVKYTVNGIDYEEEYGDFSGYEEGDKITISYNPEDPSIIVQPAGLLLPIIFIVLGVISLTIGIINLMKNRLKKYDTEFNITI